MKNNIQNDEDDKMKTTDTSKLVNEKIKELIAEELGADAATITKETTFDEDLGADSLDLFDLVMKFEDEFEVKIPTEELENIKTVGDVCDYIEKNK